MREFTKTPRKIFNYVDLITSDQIEVGWVLVPLHNMVLKHPQFKYPAMLKRNNEYTYSMVDDYFRAEAKPGIDVPFHYYIEKVVNEWDIHVGLADVNRSWFLKDGVVEGWFPQQLVNAKVIAIGDCFYEDIPEERMMRKLWNTIFSGWLRRTGRNRNYIHFFDDVVNWEIYDKAVRENKTKYDLRKSTFWNNTFFLRMLPYYKKY